MKINRKTAGIVTVVAIALIGVLSSTPSIHASLPDLSNPDIVRALQHVDSYILDQMEQNGSADFLIVLKEQADLTGVKNLKRKEDKGRFVFNKLRETATRSQVSLIGELKSAGIEYRSFYIQNMVFVKNGTFDLLLNLTTRPDVAAFYSNKPVDDRIIEKQPMAYPANETARAPEWNLQHIGITDVWAEGVTGQGIVIANFDTGVDWDHPALINKYRGYNAGQVNHDYNWHAGSSTSYCPNPCVPCDDDSHGTHTMGTMVGDDGNGNQVGGAPGAKWIACGHLDTTVGFHDCFEWFLAPYRCNESPSQGLPEMAPDIVNNSWGWPIEGGDYQYAPDIDALQSAGVFMEFSAGNEGDYCQSLRSPGDYPQVLTTGASDASDRIVSTSWTGWWGSSRGPADPSIPGAPNFIKPEIVAPGYDIRSCVPGTGYEGGWGGTSMAGPHTCAVIALLWSAVPSLRGDIDETRQILLDTAYTQPGGAGYWNQTCGGINAATTVPNHVWGWGLINAYAAYMALSGVYLDRAAYQPQDTIGITVRDRNASGSIAIQIKSTTESTWESIMLLEQATGEFQGSISCSPVPAVHGDGLVSVSNGDTIWCNYPALDQTATAMIDGVAPMISNISVLELSDSWAQITWQTSEPCRSIIHYGLTSPETIQETDSYALTHSVTLTGLTDCSLYVFDIVAEDEAANITIDDNQGNHRYFTTYERIVFLEANMDTNPGWTTQGQWAWGHPTAQGGEYGNPDPNSGYTGQNVYGYNLNGDYADAMNSAMYLTTNTIDCSSGVQVDLSFWAWLGVEQSVYDHATVEISNNGGTSWQTLWSNSDTLDGGTWEYWQFDISAIAGGHSNVKIRWSMGPTDGGWRYCGWNIDDVFISFVTPCNLPTPTPVHFCENNGDVNQDSQVTAGDAQLAFQITLGVIIPSEVEACSADCNGNEIVTAADAQSIFASVLGLGSCVDAM